MKKVLITTFTFALILFFVVWGVSILKCEILTSKYGNQFEVFDQKNLILGDIVYLKVLNYTSDTAQVYFVSENRTGDRYNIVGDILSFSKQNGKWKYDKWERTVWAKTGSADGFIWPYIR